MLLVALSLRMCCSLVCRASRYTSFPAASLKGRQTFFFGGIFLGISSPSLWPPTRHTPGDSDHPTWHHAHQVVPDGEEGGVRTAVAEGHPEPLSAAQRNVHAKLPGRTQHAESQQVRRTAGQRLDTHTEGKESGPILIVCSLIIRAQKGVNTPIKANACWNLALTKVTRGTN